MKSAVISAVALAFAGEADAFFIPAGSLVVGAPSTSLLGSSSSSTAVARAAAHTSGCSCSACNPAHGRSCGCPSCSSGIAGRTHGAGCRCGACSAASRMQAHPEGCGCVDCYSPAPAAFHGASCTCSACGAAARAHGASCTCGSCATAGPSGSSRRGASVTVMSMGDGEQEVPEAGEGLRQRLAEEPEAIMFEETMAAIADGFDYTPKRFVNGVASSDAGENEGSCKVLAFGKIAGLTFAETLLCFGEHYRSVVADPQGDEHANIRAFSNGGWEKVDFPDGLPLSRK